MKMIRVKYRGEEVSIPRPSRGKAIHRVVALQFSIPVHRVKLIFRGKTYPEAQSDELMFAACEANAPPIMVLGTASSEQLDSRQARLRHGRQWILTTGAQLPWRLWELIYSIFKFILHFFTSMVSTPQSRNTRE